VARAAAVADLAPTGTLRAAINLGNPVLASRDPATGEPCGVSVDLARELGVRLGVRGERVVFDAAGKVVDALRTGAWDVAFLAIDPKRALDIAYTPPYVEIEGAFLVRDDSPVRANADVDAPGVRVVVGEGSAYDLFLTRELKHATIVRAPTPDAVIEVFLAGLRASARAGRSRRKRHPGAPFGCRDDPAGDGRATRTRAGARYLAGHQAISRPGSSRRRSRGTGIEARRSHPEP
jgi:ABC-type amino acid transport substrate-binding protein